MNYLAAAAAVLFASSAALASEAIEFTRYDGSEMSVAIRDQFVSGMITDDSSDEAFSWARVDLDGDSYDELLIKLLAGPLCLDEECPIIGFQRTESDNWDAVLTVVGSAVAFEEKTNVLSVTSNGKAVGWQLDQGFLR